MRSKVLVFVCVAAVSISACRKAPGAETQGTTATQGSGTPPATPGQVSPATPGQAAPAAQPPAPPKPVPAQLPEVIARVNGEAVKKEDFERMLKTIEARAGQPIPAERRDEILRGALDQLITYTLLSQESKTRGVKVEAAEVDAKMGQLKSQFPNEAAFDKALKDRGMTAESLRKDAVVDLSVTKLMDAEVATLPGPSDAEAKDFYDKNQDKFKEEEQVRAFQEGPCFSQFPCREVSHQAPETFRIEHGRRENPSYRRISLEHGSRSAPTDHVDGGAREARLQGRKHRRCQDCVAYPAELHHDDSAVPPRLLSSSGKRAVQASQNRKEQAGEGAAGDVPRLANGTVVDGGIEVHQRGSLNDLSERSGRG